MDKMKMETANLAQENLEKLKEMFPEVFTETKDENGEITTAVDANKLSQALSTKVIEGDESYDFTWVGKKNAVAEVGKPIRKTLKPCKDESKDWEKTENLYIEGDNLEVLKLLQVSYLNKVKMIYIDPPYNTGNDSFIYPDDYAENKDKYDEEIGAVDENGYRMFHNTETNGRFHSSWCSMMYSRLKLSKNLLTKSGVVFISIDDHEIENLRKICNEVFGEKNFVLQITNLSNPRGRQTTRLPFALTHEYILVYAKDISSIQLSSLPYTEQQKLEYNLEDEGGRYRLLGLRKRGTASNRADRPNLFFPIYYNPQTQDIKTTNDIGYTEVIYPKKEDASDGVWRWQTSKVEEDKRLLIVKKVHRKGGNFEYDVFVKDYMERDGEEKGAKLKSVWTDKKFNNENGTECLKMLFNGKYFDFPKPLETIKELIQFTEGKDFIALDFFSGSGTTAHAVMQLNAEDGGHRKFIMVQLPDQCDEKSETFKAGYKTIAEIGKERIRRAGKKIVEETGKTDLDTGFRVFKVDETYMNDVYFKPSDYKQSMLEQMSENIKSDKNPDDLLYSCMLEWGLELSLPHTVEQIDGFNVHIVNDGDLIACFDKNITEEAIKKIADKKPLRVIFRDCSFKSDADKINVEQIFKQKCNWDDEQVRKAIKVL